jgi:hypothetical protein
MRSHALRARSGFAACSARVDPTVDATFGRNRAVALDTGGNELMNGVALQVDGKIVAVGSATPDGQVAAIYRLASNGARDAAFGLNGELLLGVGRMDTAFRVALTSRGKIVVAGSSRAHQDAIVARLEGDDRPSGGRAGSACGPRGGSMEPSIRRRSRGLALVGAGYASRVTSPTPTSRTSAGRGVVLEGLQPDPVSSARRSRSLGGEGAQDSVDDARSEGLVEVLAAVEQAVHDGSDQQFVGESDVGVGP